MNPESKPKEAKFHVINSSGSDEDGQAYDILGAQRAHHPDLGPATISLCWLLNVTSDKDGRLVLGKAIKAPPLWQQVSDIDWFIGLNRQWWQRADKPQRSCLIDHELCHMAPAIDPKTDDQVIDDHGHLQWRVVKHDIGEFLAPVQRHGIRLGDLHRFAQVIEQAQARLPFTASGAEVEVLAP